MLNIFKLKSNNVNKNYLINKGLLNNDVRHHPSSTKEWFNSIYNYYKNNEKNIPHLDTMIYKLIKNYFNMYSSRLERSIFLRKKTLKKRRYKLNNVLISKPEFKHTNDKVKITIYVYNKELSYLNVKMNNIKKIIFAQYFFKVFTTKYKTMSKLYMIKSLLNRINTLKSFIKNLSVYRDSFKKRFKTNQYYGYLVASNTIKDTYKEWSIIRSLLRYKSRSLHIVYALYGMEKKNKKLRNFLVSTLLKRPENKSKRKSIIWKFKEIKILSKSIKIIKFLSTLLNMFNNKSLSNAIDFYYEHINNMPIFSISKKAYIKKIKRMIFRLRLLQRYNRAIVFNKFKFNNFLIPLKFFLEKVYKKDVEFDIITLKNYRLNSSLLTQVIAIKLRNRNNRIMKLLSKIIGPMILPVYKKHEYFKELRKDRYLQNTILKHNINKNFVYKKPLIKMNILDKLLKGKDLNINKLSCIKYDKDKLDSLLKSIYPNQNVITNNNIIENVNLYNVKQLSSKILMERNLENVVLDSIKNKSISGIRLQASGRLTKRAVAARSMSNIIQRGIIKDINSSYKQWSSLLLKGNINSNVQFTKTNDKTRVGSFGLKGWISSM